jgi:ankyrin repeat protein
MLDKGADINASAAFGMTALWVAAMEKHQNIARLLKQAGAKE